MNAPDHQIPTSQTATASPDVVVLIHFGLPTIFSRALDIYRPAQFMILVRGLECTLRASGLLVEGTLGGAGALSEGILVFTTPERNKAIAAVKDFLEKCGLLGPFIEIAWQCKAEEILRTCWPLGPIKPFDRHLGDEAIEQRRLLTETGLTEAGYEA